MLNWSLTDATLADCPPEARTEAELAHYDEVSWWLEAFLQVQWPSE